MANCVRCEGPVTQVEFRVMGSEGFEQEIDAMYQSVLSGIDRMLMESESA